MDIKTAIINCLNNLSLAQTTRYSYGIALKNFVAFLQEREIKITDPIENLNINHFIDFIMWLFVRYKKGTATYYISASKALLDWLVISGQLRPTYRDTLRYKMANRINQRRHEERLPRFPGRDDVEKMLKAVREQDEPSPIKERNIAMLEFLASTGCRVSEMTGLNIKDIDIDNRRTIVIGKGNKERCVYLGKEAIEALKLYWSKRSLSKTDEPIFARHDKGAHSHNNIRLTTTSVRNIVRNVAVLAGLDPGKFTPHYFRHAFAIRVLGETGNLAYTQDLLGHADPKSTRIYAKIYPEDLKRVHSEIFDHKLTTKE